MVSIAYDYNSAPTQTNLIAPDNFNPAFGGTPFFGDSGVFGGPSAIEQWRIFFQQQKCQAFQITIQEIYDASKGVAAGAGLTMSGLNCIVGVKSSYPRLQAVRQIG